MKKIQLEQQPPNKPSFLTVVLIAAGAILVIFIIVLIALHLGHGRIEHPLRDHPSHPTSQLIRPSVSPDRAIAV